MDRAVLERRMKLLGNYMNNICDYKIIERHEGLRDLLMTFLEQGEYDRATGGPISATVGLYFCNEISLKCLYIFIF